MGNPIAIALGVGDLVAAFSLLFPIIPRSIALPAALYLIIKGASFAMLGNKASILDFLCGLYLISVINGYSHLMINIITGIWILQKAVLSFK